MAQSEKIIELQYILAERFPELPHKTGAIISTGVSALDAPLGGGFSKGAITELAAPFCSTGSGTIVANILQFASEENRWTALIDGCNCFDLPGALPCVLWVRCRKTDEAIRAADLLLRDGNLSLILLDLRGNSLTELRNIPSTTWYRFQRIVEQNGMAFFVIVRHSLVSSAAVKLQLQNRFTLDALDREQLHFELNITRGGGSRAGGNQFAAS